ncbi:hypothetical protein BT69DRAFT_1281091 [Atractiella rhizophila]|nr:hypothetical protein BT69DRAFT_1281091 [Atractiella rhizophila]
MALQSLPPEVFDLILVQLCEDDTLSINYLSDLRLTSHLFALHLAPQIFRRPIQINRTWSDTLNDLEPGLKRSYFIDFPDRIAWLRFLKFGQSESMESSLYFVELVEKATNVKALRFCWGISEYYPGPFVFPAHLVEGLCSLSIYIDPETYEALNSEKKIEPCIANLSSLLRLEHFLFDDRELYGKKRMLSRCLKKGPLQSSLHSLSVYGISPKLFNDSFANSWDTLTSLQMEEYVNRDHRWIDETLAQCSHQLRHLDLTFETFKSLPSMPRLLSVLLVYEGVEAEMPIFEKFFPLVFHSSELKCMFLTRFGTEAACDNLDRNDERLGIEDIRLEDCTGDIPSLLRCLLKNGSVKCLEFEGDETIEPWKAIIDSVHEGLQELMFWSVEEEMPELLPALAKCRHLYAISADFAGGVDDLLFRDTSLTVKYLFLNFPGADAVQDFVNTVTRDRFPDLIGVYVSYPDVETMYFPDHLFYKLTSSEERKLEWRERIDRAVGSSKIEPRFGAEDVSGLRRGLRLEYCQ